MNNEDKQVNHEEISLKLADREDIYVRFGIQLRHLMLANESCKSMSEAFTRILADDDTCIFCFKEFIINIAKALNANIPINFNFLRTEELDLAINDIVDGFSIADCGCGVDCNLLLCGLVAEKIYGENSIMEEVVEGIITELRNEGVQVDDTVN